MKSFLRHGDRYIKFTDDMEHPPIVELQRHAIGVALDPYDLGALKKINQSAWNVFHGRLLLAQRGTSLS